MERHRIQKLLSSEYREFSERVLVESPFAETSREGRGVRQVALGLTASKLIIAADILRKNSQYSCHRNVDPSIESFELVSVYPLELVRLSIFRRRKRKTLKARLIDGRVKYFELGGSDRGSSWRLWRKNIRILLLRTERSSSLSETSAATSTSTSSFYLVSSDLEPDPSAKALRKGPRIWAHYVGGGDSISGSWFRKDIYLGPSYSELSTHGFYTPRPIRFADASLEQLKTEFSSYNCGRKCARSSAKNCTSWPCEKSKSKAQDALCDVLFTREKRKRALHPQPLARSSSQNPKNNPSTIKKKRSSTSEKKQVALAPKLSRFGFGISENCASGLYLEPWTGDRDHFCRPGSSRTRSHPRDLLESSVELWESQRNLKLNRRHPRRYALTTAAHFLHALGPWTLTDAEKLSVQRARASSAVEIRRQPQESELRLDVSKKQLSTRVSMSSLQTGGTSGSSGASGSSRLVLFWTTDYWYRPRAATQAYRELRRHLNALRDFRAEKELPVKKTFFSRRKSTRQPDCRADSGTSEITRGSSCIFSRMFCSREPRRGNEKKEDGGTAELRQLLRMELRVTAWDIDSTTLARQLSLVERDLFLRIPCGEIEILVWKKSSRNASNVGAWIAFGHRISCLVASQVLATKVIDRRARIVCRFVNVADKCLAMGNFQSCRSVLVGLQSPAIYRLRDTWDYVRTRHASRYESMERMCKIFGSWGRYRRAWRRSEEKTPALPFVGELLDRVLREEEEEEEEFDCGARGSDDFFGYRRSKLLENSESGNAGYVHFEREEERIVCKFVEKENEVKPKSSEESKQRSLKESRSGSGKSVNFKKENETLLAEECSCGVENVDFGEEGESREKSNEGSKRSFESRRTGSKGKDVGCKKEDKVERKCNEKFVTRNELSERSSEESRQSFPRRILSAVVLKIGARKSEPSFRDPPENESIFSSREKVIVERACKRWRSFVLKRRLLAEREARLAKLDSRRRRIVQVGSWLLDCQRKARDYNFARHSLAREFILKARYREDRENFLLSLKLEPPCG